MIKKLALTKKTIQKTKHYEIQSKPFDFEKRFHSL